MSPVGGILLNLIQKTNEYIACTKMLIYEKLIIHEHWKISLLCSCPEYLQSWYLICQASCLETSKFAFLISVSDCFCYLQERQLVISSTVCLKRALYLKTVWSIWYKGNSWFPFFLFDVACDVIVIFVLCFCTCVYRRSAFDAASLCNRSHLPSLDSLRWRVDVAISTR